MEKKGPTYDEAMCSYQGVDYPLGYELCMDDSECKRCHNGTWVDRDIRMS